MADTLSIVTFSTGGRPIEVLDLNDGVNYIRDRESGITYTPAASTVQYSRSGRRFGGGHAVGESHDNGLMGWSAYVKASTGALAVQAIESLLTEIQDAARGRYLMSAPEGQPVSYMEIAGPGTWQPQLRPREFADSHAMLIAITFPVLPLVQWDRMQIEDDFSLNTLDADYTWLAGHSGLTVTGGRIVSSSVSAFSAFHTARGYLYQDAQQTLKIHIGSALGVFSQRLYYRATDFTNTLYCEMSSSGIIRIGKLVAGTATSMAALAGADLSLNTDRWMRVRAEGNLITAEWWNTPPTPMATPPISVTFVLTSTESQFFDSGLWGPGRFIAGAADSTWTYDDYALDPYTYRSRTLPDTIRLGGDIPGDAPALADISITHSGGAVAPAFAMVAWSPRPSVFSYVPNGDFAVDTTGWKVTVDDNFAAATSITRVTADPQAVGGTAGEVVTTAVTNSGGTFRVYGDFKKGTTYTFVADIWSATGTTLTQVLVGRTSDAATTASVALTTTKQTRTGTWTPTADHDFAVIGARVTAATLTTFRIANVAFYEGTVAPTLYSQTEGRGGRAPFGLFEGVNALDLSGWVVTANAGARGGNRLEDATVSGAETYTASWIIDPATMVPDDFTAGELALEVWGRYQVNVLNVTPKFVWSVRPLDGTNFGAERFTSEWGSGGQIVTLPSASTALRWRRFGTIMLAVDPLLPRPVKLWVTASVAAGSTGTFALDYIYVGPLRSRALSPIDEQLNTLYPKFVTSTSETTKTVRSDLSGVISSPPSNPYPDRGLGGSIIELPSGPVDMVVKLSTLAPGDTTVDTSTEQLSHTATTSISPIPRSYMLRDA